jgi:hypothetical protein
MPRLRNRADQALTDLVSAFPEPDDQILEDFFPSVPTSVLSGFWHRWSKSNQLELLETTPLGDDDRVPEVTVALDADSSFRCGVYARRSPVGRITAADAAEHLGWAERSALKAASSLRLELRYIGVNRTLRDPNKLPGVTLTSDRRFDNRSSTSSQPIVDLQLYVDQASRTCGRRINRIGMTGEVFTAISQHDDVLDRLKYRGEMLTVEKLEDWLRVPRGTVRLYDAQYRSSKKGQTVAYRKYLGSDIVLAFIEPPSLAHAGMGVCFAFGGLSPERIAVVETYDPNRGPLGTDYKTAVSIADFNVTNADAGFVIRGCVDTTNSAYSGYLD